MHLEEQKIWEYLYMSEVADRDMIEKHLIECVACSDKRVEIESDELMFSKLFYPTVTADFTARTSARILRKQTRTTDLWTLVLHSTLWFSSIFIAFFLLYKLHQKDIIIEVPAFNLSAWVSYLIPVIFLLFLVLFQSRSKSIAKL